MNRPPPRPVSVQELRRIAETLSAVRSGTVSGAVMRSDRRQLQIEMADGQLVVVSADLDESGRPQLEVDVIRPRTEPGSQLEVRFESA